MPWSPLMKEWKTLTERLEKGALPRQQALEDAASIETLSRLAPDAASAARKAATVIASRSRARGFFIACIQSFVSPYFWFIFLKLPD